MGYGHELKKNFLESNRKMKSKEDLKKKCFKSKKITEEVKIKANNYNNMKLNDNFLSRFYLYN